MNLPRIGVLDYGSGNLHSVCRALVAAGGDVTLSSAPREFAALDALVLPGVGAFAACMSQLSAVGGDDLVRDWVAAGRKLLAICVGHQVLFEAGVEHGEHSRGIGVLPGTVVRLSANRLPHMGWNTLEHDGPPGVFGEVAENRFYFVHSYAAHMDDSAGQDGFPADATVSWARHEDDRFIAAVQWHGVTSTQFHPEKSGASGAALLRNWIMR